MCVQIARSSEEGRSVVPVVIGSNRRRSQSPALGRAREEEVVRGSISFPAAAAEFGFLTASPTSPSCRG
jgi:hypothetical protein